ncbi:uncharacterized protein LOC132610223 [Lycium barbarum]|uniref:uncharacterized protein LOC132610223 n=1 Tax=Lycium barbarum TaxID=112863 RepID=UPI00293F6D3C|nr:uncharacterized protein LOC132610223 [Lycium barbarum]
MDTKNKKDFKGEKIQYVDNVEAPKSVLNGEKDEDDESKALLLPSRKGGLSKKTVKPKRKVQWNDTNGNKLTEVLEFQPSDASDSDDDESDSCICRIM